MLAASTSTQCEHNRAGNRRDADCSDNIRQQIGESAVSGACRSFFELDDGTQDGGGYDGPRKAAAIDAIKLQEDQRAEHAEEQDVRCFAKGWSHGLRRDPHVAGGYDELKVSSPRNREKRVQQIRTKQPASSTPQTPQGARE